MLFECVTHVSAMRTTLCALVVPVNSRLNVNPKVIVAGAERMAGRGPRNR